MECIFCKIVKHEIQSKVLYEDEKVIVVLDVNPRSKGMCLVIPKKHYENPEDDLDTSEYLFRIASSISKAIKKSLNPIFVSISYMPSQFKHFHLRVYPFYEKNIPIFENRPIKTSEEELNKVLNLIKPNIKIEKKKIEIKKEEKKEPEKKEEKKTRSKEDVYWIKRSMALA